MTSLKTSIKTITYLSDIGCLEIQGASLMPSMIAIILLIILHIWLCRQGGDHFWSESRLNISLLMLDIEHLARGKGLR